MTAILRRSLLAAALLASPAAGAAQARTTLPDNGPYTQPPQLLNPVEVTQLARASYPPQLKEMGLGGSPTVRLYVDETGAIRERRIERSSALAGLDSAALKVVDAMRFAPARNGDQPTHLWVSFPVRFRIAAASTEPGPPKTPPRVLNLRDVELALGRRMDRRETRADHWPRVAVFVGADGKPAAIELSDPSGDPALDAAALLAVLESRFEPGRNAAGDVVESWLLITVRPER